MAPAPGRAFIVSHTHWDREWYLTYHRFRVNLGYVVLRILDALEGEEAFRHFVLDGQAIVLEDYLEAYPDDESRIRRLVTEGALSIGPWYVLPDEFLVSGEALVRNLIVGHKVCESLGGVQKVGYLPDSFGHAAQIPQILARSGIDSFIYTRGNGDEIDALGCEYMWIAPDGSEVLAINQCFGYYNAASLGYVERWHALTQRDVDPALAVEQVGKVFSDIERLTNGDTYLLNNGSDHLPPQKELGAILKHLKEAFPKTEFIHTGFRDYVDAVRAAGIATKRHSGELLGGKYYHILSGVWSARMYIKQQNDLAQTLLSNYVEPFCAYAHFALGQDYPGDLIEYAWKLLMENHPHDSICGCSTDAVHREMMPRFAGVIDTGEQLVRLGLEPLAPTFATGPEGDDDTVLCVANTLPVERTEVVERLFVLQGTDADVERMGLYDSEGRPVPFVLVGKKYVKRFWGVDFRSELFHERQNDLFRVYIENFGADISDRPLVRADDCLLQDCFAGIQFVASDLPSLGHATYHLREHRAGEEIPPPPDVVAVEGNTIENAFYVVTVREDGAFDVLDKASGRTYTGLNALEDTEDVGDEYDYSPCPNSETIRADAGAGRLRTVEDTGLAGCIEAELALRLPESITDDRERRGSKRVECRVRSRVRLTSGGRRIEVRLTFDNRAKDHRLRVAFPTSIRTDTVLSDGHFYVNRRSIEQPDGARWVQSPTGTYPQQNFSLVQDTERGFAVLSRGLPEIAAERCKEGSVALYLTLLRSVGWLSRDDFPTRKFSNAGPTLHTPEGQCLGTHRFDYALVPFTGDWISADISGLSDRFRTPVVTKQGVQDHHVPGGSSLLSRRTRLTAITAVKRHETRDTLIVRLFNLTDRRVGEELTLGKDVRASWTTNLLENRKDELPVRESRRVEITLEPHEIVTVELELDGQ